VKDVNAAALREKYAGVAKDYDPFYLITVSSGVGGALFANGKVVLGKDGLTGGWGHLTIYPHSKVICGCGNRGCLEAFASGNAAERIANEKAQKSPLAFKRSDLYHLTRNGKCKINNRMLAQAIRARDAFSQEVLDEVTRPLALAIRNQFTMFAVEKIVVMGGFALSMWDDYKKSLVNNLCALPRVLRLGQETRLQFFNDLIIPGTADDLSGVIGAAIATGKVKFK
jgi:glucokinase